MAGNISQNIITDGLILYLDAANDKSYGGTTSWNDISNDIKGMMVGATLSNMSIKFDGINDYAYIPTNLTPFDQVTIEVWIKPLSSTSTSVIFEHSTDWNTQSGGFGLAVNTSGEAVNSNVCHTAFWNTSLSPRNYEFTCGTQSYSCHVNIFSNISDATGRLTYVNGVLLPYTSIGGYSTSTQTSSGSNFLNTNMYLASRAGLSTFLNGNISILRVYNRKLSSSEISQNYNATKIRFGL